MLPQRSPAKKVPLKKHPILSVDQRTLKCWVGEMTSSNFCGKTNLSFERKNTPDQRTLRGFSEKQQTFLEWLFEAEEEKEEEGINRKTKNNSSDLGCDLIKMLE